MIKLLADENVPRRLVHLIRDQGVDIIRLQGQRARGISDKELIDMSNRLGRAILTRDQDFTSPHLLSLVKNGVIYISFQPLKNELSELAVRIANMVKSYEPRPAFLIIIGREHVEIYK